MLAVIGIPAIGTLLLLLAIISGIFFHRSENISYNPCSSNVYKDDYRQFIIIGIFHSMGIAGYSIAQLLEDFLPRQVSLHLGGSLQILSLIPTMVYYHIHVINYKCRWLEVRHRGHDDYRRAILTEGISFFVYGVTSLFAVLLFMAETAYPAGIYSKMQYDPLSGWELENYEMLGYVTVRVATFLLGMNLFRVIRNCYRILRTEIEPDQSTQYFFSKYISKNVVPHFVNDFLTLFLPTQYLIVRIAPIMHLNAFDVLAKCLLIGNPFVFVIIYMVQIRLATMNVSKEEMRCRCFVCAEKAARAQSRSINLKVMRLAGRRKRTNNEGGGAAAVMAVGGSEQPTETAPTTEEDRIEVSEDNL
ncbi:unnamed protein product [Caenorhabditis sp. 36 PRJEB53466]|nr:unnamed protein product [Caenorhabditis sp. 36 PRJEB53466]